MTSQITQPMKILNDHVDRKRLIGCLSLVPESQDDIYELESVLSVGDQIKSHTHRKVLLDAKTQVKMNLFLKIKIETINVDLTSSIIYAKGRTCEENEHVKLGSYHTIEIVLDKKFDLCKEEWTQTQLKTLKECTIAKQDILFVVMYEKECVISKVDRNRVHVKSKIEIKNKKYQQIVNSLAVNMKSVEIIVITSFFETRNDLYKVLAGHKDFKEFKSICVVKLPAELKKAPNSNVINYVLTDPSTSKQFSSIKHIDDLKEANNFFTEFEKHSELVCVGRKEIDEGIEYGALDSVFLTDEVYKPNTVDKRKEIDRFCNLLDTYRIKLYIIPVSHYLGGRLKELGGISGLLRFNYK